MANFSIFFMKKMRKKDGVSGGRMAKTVTVQSDFPNFATCMPCACALPLSPIVRNIAKRIDISGGESKSDRRKCPHGGGYPAIKSGCSQDSCVCRNKRDEPPISS